MKRLDLIIKKDTVVKKWSLCVFIKTFCDTPFLVFRISQGEAVSRERD